MDTLIQGVPKKYIWADREREGICTQMEVKLRKEIKLDASAKTFFYLSTSCSWTFSTLPSLYQNCCPSISCPDASLCFFLSLKINVISELAYMKFWP